jgi:hypothetical protein
MRSLAIKQARRSARIRTLTGQIPKLWSNVCPPANQAWPDQPWGPGSAPTTRDPLRIRRFRIRVPPVAPRVTRRSRQSLLGRGPWPLPAVPSPNGRNDVAARVVAPPHSRAIMFPSMCTQVVSWAHRPDGAPKHVHDRVLQVISDCHQGFYGIIGLAGLNPDCATGSTAPEHRIHVRLGICVVRDQADRAVEAGRTHVRLDYAQG